jgi:hypothetical protein
MRRFAFFCIFTTFLTGLASLASARTEQRLHFAPRLSKGLVLRYRIETNTSSDEHTVTPIVDPEGASQYKQSTSLVLRIEVLDVPSPQAPAQSIHLRATFERADSGSTANSYAPEAAALDDAIQKLQGQSFDFSLDPANKMVDVRGLDQIAPDREVAGRLLSWAHVLFAPVDLPTGGVSIGQKWTSERQLDGMPLTGLSWRNDSTYLHNEPCPTQATAKGASAAHQGDCAVLLTRFNISRHGSSRSDATPEAYLRSGLRTSGSWTGSGESLESISLVTGFLVSSTQTATQNMDYQIWSASSGSRIHHSGHSTTQTEITLLSAEPKS